MEKSRITVTIIGLWLICLWLCLFYTAGTSSSLDEWDLLKKADHLTVMLFNDSCYSDNKHIS